MIPTINATVASDCTISPGTGHLVPSTQATKMLAPNAIPAPAQVPPVCRMPWNMIIASRITAKPIASGPKSRTDQPVAVLPPDQAAGQREANRRGHGDGGSLMAKATAQHDVRQRREERECE